MVEASLADVDRALEAAESASDEYRHAPAAQRELLIEWFWDIL